MNNPNINNSTTTQLHPLSPASVMHVCRGFGTLLLGPLVVVSLLLGLASPAGAQQQQQMFPSPIGFGSAPTEDYIDLHYNVGEAITPVQFPAATGDSGTWVYSMVGEQESLGFTFDPATRTLSGTPTLAGAGPSKLNGFELTYMVDADVFDDTITVYITVCEGTGSPAGTTSCTPPAFAELGLSEPLAGKGFVSGAPLTLQLVEGTGGTGDNPTLKYRVTNLPDGLEFDSDTRTITGTPTTVKPGTVTYFVEDAASGEQLINTFGLQITPGSGLALPEIPIPTQPYTELNLNLVLPEATSGTDPKTYTLNPLPPGLDFDASTRTLSGTPTSSERYVLTYTVTDSASPVASATQTLTLVPPRVPIGDLFLPAVRGHVYSAGEDINPPVTVSEGKKVPEVVPPESLPEAEGGVEPYTYSMPDLPTGLTFDATARTLTGSTTAGEYELTYTVTDGSGTPGLGGAGDGGTGGTPGATVSEKFMIEVIDGLALDYIDDRSLPVDEPSQYWVLPAATGGSGLTYTLSPLPPGLVFDEDADERTLFGTPTAVGIYDLTYTVTGPDNSGETATYSRTFRVNITGDKDDDGDDTFADLNAVILPEIARAMADQTVSAITQRIDQTRSGGDARSVNIGGQSSLAAVVSAHGEALSEGRLDLKEMLAGSGFTLPLNAVDGAVGRSSATFWASGDYRDLSGESGNLNWDGNLFGIHLGVDARLSEDLLAGVAISRLQGDLDYEDDTGTLGEGAYKIDMTSAYPYVGWSAGELDLWATAGYGKGKVEITAQGETTRSSDIKMRTVGGGGSGKLLERDATTVRLKGEALQTTLKVDASTGIEQLEVNATRLRMTVEGSQSHAMADGALFEPSMEVGVRYDGGDGETGAGVELGGRLSYRNPATRITAEGRIRALLGHSGNYQEWGIQGRLALQPKTDGRGLSFSLSPGYGNSGDGIRKLWQHGLLENDADVADYSARMDARLGYGFSFALNGYDGVLMPYSELTLDTTDSYRLGMSWKAGTRFDLNLLGERREAGSNPTEHTLLLKGAMRF